MFSLDLSRPTASSGATTVGQSVDLASPYPVPAAQSARVEVTVAQAQHVTVRAFDMLGRAVATLHDGAMQPGTAILAVDVAALAPGLYAIRAEGPFGVATRQLVVAR